VSFDVGGFTCVEGDILTKGLAEPLAVGDFLVYENVGSYSVVMKPPFILPDVPILRTRVDSSGARSFDVIRRAQTVDQVFETFVW
jgi:diaminopimelate decarboxylase